jgi:hypothetical protein
LPVRLPAGREARDGAARRRLRRLAAGVRVDLGVEHEHVDVLVGRQDVIEAAVADVVGPAVAADDPHGLLHQVVGDARQLGRATGARREDVLQQPHALALLVDAGSSAARASRAPRPALADLRRQFPTSARARRRCWSIVRRMP